MFKHALIAVALDHEGLVADKIAFARKVLSEGGRITLLTVLEDVPGFVAEFVDDKGENHLTQKVKSKLAQWATDADDVEVAVAKGKPGVQIPRYADEHDVDVIVAASHHPSATDYFLGSTASRIVRRADCAVMILR